LTFRIKGQPKDTKNTPYFFYSLSRIEVEKQYWNDLHTKNDFLNYKDIEKQNWAKDIKEKQYQINTKIDNLRSHVLDSFNLIADSKALDLVNKEWLQKQIEVYYNPPKNKEEEERSKIPTSLIGYIDFYAEYRKHETSEALRKKNNVVKRKLVRFQKQHQNTILIKDVNDKFKNEFVNYCIEQGYSQNTIQREIVIIKTFCKHARFLGLEVHSQMDGLRLDRQKVQSIHLPFEELEQIEKTSDLAEYQENAKDWLIISCYLGQRVSDFLKFTSDLIRYEDGKPLLEFTQQKTKKVMTIPVHKKVIEILNKRNGQFPRQISDVNYNLYIKEVCEKAGLTQMVTGSKKVETAPKSKQYRKQTKMYQKWELVTSHIGRRSFATNFYGKIPTTYLIYITGHSTEQAFLTYIGKSNKDIAKEVFSYFE
jgi:integrase